MADEAEFVVCDQTISLAFTGQSRRHTCCSRPESHQRSAKTVACHNALR
jgi:hypothetical protein